MYKINKKILKTPIEENSILLLEPKQGLYFELNEVSVLIYQCINEGLEESEILKQVIDKYDVSEPKAQIDISELIEQLLSNNIIHT